MDENYLDNLLNEFSLDKEIDHRIEEELDREIQQEEHEQAVSPEDEFNQDLEKDASEGSVDGSVQFSEAQMDELDALDDMADMDMKDLDFSNIDFNDLDMTKLSKETEEDFDQLLKEFEGDFEIPDFFEEDSGLKSTQEKQAETDLQSETDLQPEMDVEPEEGQLNEDHFDADSFLDSLLDDESTQAAEDILVEDEQEEKESETEESVKEAEQEAEEPEEPQSEEDQQKLAQMLKEEEEKQWAEALEKSGLLDADNPMPKFSGEEGTDTAKEEQTDRQMEQQDEGKESEDGLSTKDSADLDALFSMLNLDGDENGETPAEEVSKPEKKRRSYSVERKKRSWKEILFGEPDEDDVLSEEELQAIAEKKAAKKAKKQAAKARKEEKAKAAKENKTQQDNQKKKDAQEKQRLKAEKKAKKKAEALKNAEPEKKLNRPAVAFIFSIFIGGAVFCYLASNNFDYKLAVQNAANYFEKQKYHNAYDEIKGVEVRKEDETLKDRIYTVMYVERLYEGYENNLKLGQQEKALDCLLRGVDKYYEYREEAQRLDIVSDLDHSFEQIQTALQDNYGITIDRAVEINNMTNHDYAQTVEGYAVSK